MGNWREQIFDSLQIAETSTTAAGPVPITGPRSVIVTSGAIAITLADGKLGQVILITMRTDGGTATMTPYTTGNFKNITSVAFNDIGDWIAMEFDGLKWAKLDSKGVTIA